MSCQSATCIFVLCAVFAAHGAFSQNAPAAPPIPSDAGWPRQYSDGTAKLVLQQPQVDNWQDFKKLAARIAIELTPAKGAQPAWGVLSVESDTLVNLESRQVAFENFKVTGISFPSAKDAAQAKTWEELTTKLLPAYPTSVAMERVMAYLDKSVVKARETPVLLDPPLILVSAQPAVLVMIDGKTVLLDIENTGLQKVANTNWDLFLDKKEKRYYLRDGKSWLSTQDLKGAWSPVAKLPKDFSKLPATEQYKEVSETVAKPQKPDVMKLVLVVDKPAELIVLNGEPNLQPISGTNLMWVMNTESDLFVDSTSGAYYFLTSGRWFRAAELKSKQWTPATTSLPEDFKKVPVDHPRAHILAAVPGTRQAEEAILEASIPRTATIDRSSIKGEASYVGDPKFEPIEGANGVSYASNTPNDVFLVEGKYYLCLQGVWFVSVAANGPWEPTDKVPEAIYSIPPSSSKHNVTYVTIQESTPTTVTYGYTAGYMGVYVGYGVAMWGTGYYYPPYYGYGYYPYYWPCPYYTYGASAWYNPATGTYGRGSAVYGPYGGAARGAAYNPATGSYAWGRAAWGPYGAAATGGFYNPSTGGWGGRYHASNGYQSWGQSVVGRGDQWMRTGHYSDSRGTVAGIETSRGGKAIGASGSQGQGFIGRSAAGDVYAGRDGNVYKRDQSGNWYKNSGGGSWDSVDRPSSAGTQQARVGQTARSGEGTAAALGGGASRDSVQSLNRDASARSQGNYNAQRSQSSRMSTGRSSSGWSSPRGGYSRGGFGRRR